MTSHDCPICGREQRYATRHARPCDECWEHKDDPPLTEDELRKLQLVPKDTTVDSMEADRRRDLAREVKKEKV